MKNGKKIAHIMAVMVITLFATVMGAQALTVQLTDPYPTPSYNGGPFRATVLDPAPYSISNSVFDTFCLEYTEYFNIGATLYGSISNAAVAGAGGAIADPSNPGRTYDPLDIRTQKLYDYYLDNQAVLDSDHRAAMQLAIWSVEQEIDPTTYNGLLTVAIRGYADEYLKNVNSYILDRQIQVLNLYGDASLSYESRKQSQLVQIPEPITIIFLGSGILGLALYSRLKRKN